MYSVVFSYAPYMYERAALLHAVHGVPGGVLRPTPPFELKNEDEGLLELRKKNRPEEEVASNRIRGSDLGFPLMTHDKVWPEEDGLGSGSREEANVRTIRSRAFPRGPRFMNSIKGLPAFVVPLYKAADLIIKVSVTLTNSTRRKAFYSRRVYRFLSRDVLILQSC